MPRRIGAGTPSDAACAGGTDAGEQGIDRRTVGGEERLALGSDAVALAAGVFGFDGRIPHVLEPGEGRIDHAWARAVTAAHAFLDGFHEFVAVPRLLGDHGQHEEPKLAVVERPSATPAAELVAMMVMPPVTAIRRVIGLGETTV